VVIQLAKSRLPSFIDGDSTEREHSEIRLRVKTLADVSPNSLTNIHMALLPLPRRFPRLFSGKQLLRFGMTDDAFYLRKTLP
jgi:hypothetical protein